MCVDVCFCAGYGCYAFVPFACLCCQAGSCIDWIKRDGNIWRDKREAPCCCREAPPARPAAPPPPLPAPRPAPQLVAPAPVQIPSRQLDVAVARGDAGAVSAALQAGATLAAPAGAAGHALLRTAAAGDHVAVARLLLARGADLDASSGAPPLSALEAAAAANAQGALSLLLDRGAKAGDAALTLAADNGHALAVATLLAAGAKADTVLGGRMRGAAPRGCGRAHRRRARAAARRS